MVQDVLRALPAHRLAAADLSSLGKLSPEYVSDELRTRHGDTVWRLRLGRRPAFLLVLLEFQARDDHWMALRILTYGGLLYQELLRSRPPEIAGERLPALLPVVLYNGSKPWTAAADLRALITPVGPWLAPCQPAQRYCLLDLRRVAADVSPLPQPAARGGAAGAEPVAAGRGTGGAGVAALVAAAGAEGVAARVRGLDTADRRMAGAGGSDAAGGTDAGGDEHVVGRTGRRMAQAVAPGRP